MRPTSRIAVQQGWISGYTDGASARTMLSRWKKPAPRLIKLAGYDVTTLSGTFPAAQLNKANELGRGTT